MTDAIVTAHTDADENPSHTSRFSSLDKAEEYARYLRSTKEYASIRIHHGSKSWEVDY